MLAKNAKNILLYFIIFFIKYRNRDEYTIFNGTKLYKFKFIIQNHF